MKPYKININPKTGRVKIVRIIENWKLSKAEGHLSNLYNRYFSYWICETKNGTYYHRELKKG